MPRHLTNDERKDIEEVFHLYDDDESGTIDMKEMPTLLRYLGFNPSEAQCTYLMRKYDTNDKTLDFREFITLCETEDILATDFEDDLKTAFDAFDTDGSGKLTFSKVKEALMTRGEPIPDDELTRMFNGVEDGDGLLDFDEFKRLMTGGEAKEVEVSSGHESTTSDGPPSPAEGDPGEYHEEFHERQTETPTAAPLEDNKSTTEEPMPEEAAPVVVMLEDANTAAKEASLGHGTTSPAAAPRRPPEADPTRYEEELLDKNSLTADGSGRSRHRCRIWFNREVIAEGYHAFELRAARNNAWNQVNTKIAAAENAHQAKLEEFNELQRMRESREATDVPKETVSVTQTTHISLPTARGVKKYNVVSSVFRRGHLK